MSTFKSIQVVQKVSDFKSATEIITQPLRPPTADEFRVRVVYVGINAADINFTANRYGQKLQLPYGAGLEALGVIDEIGQNHAQVFEVGQPVLVPTVEQLDGFSEYLYRDKVDQVFPVPELDPRYLVLFINGLTAAIGLDHAGQVKEGDKVLVTAAAGGTGQIVVQWAKHRGAEVVALTSSDEKAAYLKELGADQVINYRKQDIDTTLTELYPNGVDVIWETIGGETFNMLFEHLAKRGRMVIIGSITSYKTAGFSGLSIDNLNGRLLTESKVFAGFILPDFCELYAEYFEKAVELFQAGKLIVKIDDGQNTPEGVLRGLEDVLRAEEWLHSGGNLGKVIVKVTED